MKDYIEEIRALKESLTRQVELLENNAEDDNIRWKICCDMQKEMLDLGMVMDEEPHLHESRIIAWFEICCELCYQFAEKKKVDSFFETMKYMLFCIECEYGWSLPKDAYELSIAAIIKNERNIIEWLEYHLMVGVEHFYIYDNESTDGLKEKLEPYIERGVVTYIYFPGKYQQHPASRHAFKNFKYETKWLAIIDGDEYIVPVKEGWTLPQVIKEIEKNWNEQTFKYAWFLGSIGINWRDYGTSGHKTPVDGLIIENYLYRAEDDYFQNVHIKSIYNPRIVADINNPHYADLNPGWACITEKGSYIPGSYFYDSKCELVRVNHYFSKSEEELVAKNRRGWPDRDLQRDDDNEIFEASVNCNKVYDPIMQRYVAPLKERMKM